MLILVHGVKGIDYLVSRLSRDVNVLITYHEVSQITCPDVTFERQLQRVVFLTLIRRLLRVQDDDLSVILNAVSNLSSLGEVIRCLLECNIRSSDVYYLLSVLSCCLNEASDVRIDESGTTVITVPLVEPASTILSVLYAYWIMCKVDASRISIAVPVNYVDEIYDVLLPLRSFRSAYICSLRLPRTLEIFDEVYMTVVPEVRSRGLSLVKVLDDRAYSIQVSSTELNLVEPLSRAFSRRMQYMSSEEERAANEVISALSEVSSISLSALIDSIEHTCNVSKDVVYRAISKLERLKMISIRYLPDGRIVVSRAIQPHLEALVRGRADAR